VAKTPEALNSIADSINVLAKAGGIDATTAMDALTTAMLQMGVDMANPTEAARVAAEMINVMAAGAKEGAAEIPQISEALTVAGATAKASGVGFLELNAGIQVLATGGKYGAEAGTALRNVMIKMQETSKEAEVSLSKVGLSGKDLAETLSTKGLGGALALLNEKMKDVQDPLIKNQVLIDLFGMENISAGAVLVSNSAKLEDFKNKMKGTNVAYEQATINMNTMSEAQKRMNANIEAVKIDIFKQLEPVLMSIMGEMDKMFKDPSMKQGIKDLTDGLGTMIKIGWDIMKVYKSINETVTGMIRGIKSGFDEAWNFVTGKKQEEKKPEVIKGKQVQGGLMSNLLPAMQMKGLESAARLEAAQKAELEKAQTSLDDLQKQADKYKETMEKLAIGKRQNTADYKTAEREYNKLSKEIERINALFEKPGKGKEQKTGLDALKESYEKLMKAQNDMIMSGGTESETFQKNTTEAVRLKKEIESLEKAIKKYNDEIEKQAKDGGLLDKTKVRTTRTRIDKRDLLEPTAAGSPKVPGLDTQLMEESLIGLQDLNANIWDEIGGTAVNAIQSINEALGGLTFAENLKDTMGMSKDLFKEHTVAFKAFAIAEATIATYLAASRAIIESPGGVVLGIIQAALITAAGLMNVAKIAGIKGFSEGGFTGNLGKNEPAGIVHGQEYVVNADATRRNRELLEYINDGGNIDTYMNSQNIINMETSGIVYHLANIEHKLDRATLIKAERNYNIKQETKVVKEFAKSDYWRM
jgi:TP901 family phage tail tape measure protein